MTCQACKDLERVRESGFELPHMPLYVRDLLADTVNLDTAEFGAYLRMICFYWTTREPLPDDDRQLASLANFSRHKWKNSADLLRKFFKKCDGGFLHQKRVDAELVTALNKRLQKRSAGKASANGRTNGRINGRSLPVGTGEERGGNQSESESEEDSVLRTGDGPPPDPPDGEEKKAGGEDPKVLVFGVGLKLLKKAGMKPDAARTFLGKLCADWGDEAAAAAVGGAALKNPVDPKSFLVDAAKRHSGRSGLGGRSKMGQGQRKWSSPTGAKIA